MSKPIKASDGMKLNRSERKRFADLEGRIDKGKKAFLEVGRALAEIHSSKLYRERDSTFEAYCQRRHNFTPQRAAQLMDAVEVVESISGHTSTMVEVSNERQARELANIPAETRAKTWDEAVASAPKDDEGKPNVTAAVVRKAAARGPAASSPIPKPIRDALEAGVTHHDQALNLITQISTTLNELMGDGDSKKPMRGGELLAGFRQQVKTDIKNLRETVKASKPHAVCPYCKGDGRKCNACKGLGWVSKQIFDESPAEMKGAKAA